MLRRRIRNQDIFDLIAAAGSLLCGLLVRTKWLDRSTVVVEFLIGFQRLLVSHCDASEQGCNDLRALILVLIVFADELMHVAYGPHGTQLRPMSILSGFRTLIALVVVVKLLCGG